MNRIFVSLSLKSKLIFAFVLITTFFTLTLFYALTSKSTAVNNYNYILDNTVTRLDHVRHLETLILANQQEQHLLRVP